METPNTNNIVKSFFINNWLSLLLIAGVAVAGFFIFQRISEVNQHASEMNEMLQEQNNSINENHETIDNLNKTVVAEREAREALRRDYEERMETVRSNLQDQIDRIRRARTNRTSDLANNPSELVNSYNSTFGFGRRATP
jgi:hypothetical protein